MVQDDIIGHLLRIAHHAGKVIMAHYGGPVEVEKKSDSSPVTDADRDAEHIILDSLEKLAPDIPAVSEEAAAAGSIPQVGDRFFLVDPLDGTREFVKGNGEFTVNIAMIEGGCPVIGVVYAPDFGRMFWTDGPESAFECQMRTDQPFELHSQKPLNTRQPQKQGMDVLSSRSHAHPDAQALLAGYKIARTRGMGSSIKFCLIAAGEADLYPRAGRTMEWDTAAGHAVLAAAGGGVVTAQKRPLSYGKTTEGFANPSFLAQGWQ